jgi:hypothetical protein
MLLAVYLLQRVRGIRDFLFHLKPDMRSAIFYGAYAFGIQLYSDRFSAIYSSQMGVPQSGFQKSGIPIHTLDNILRFRNYFCVNLGSGFLLSRRSLAPKSMRNWLRTNYRIGARS